MIRIFLMLLMVIFFLPSAQAQIAFAPTDFIKKIGAKKVGADWKVDQAIIRFELLDGLAYKIEYLGSPTDTHFASKVMLLMINNMSSVDALEQQMLTSWFKNKNLGAFVSPGSYFDAEVNWTSERLQFKVMTREITELGQDRLIFGRSGVLMRVFSDFQCPGCKSFLSEMLPFVTDKWINTGQLRYSYRHFPLSYHPKAVAAAIAAECSARQNKFWEYHLLLVKSLEYMVHAKALKFDSSFQGCLSDSGVKQIVLADLQIAKTQRLPATPSVIIGSFLVREHGQVDMLERYIRMARVKK
jgi:protein-disulfide isomerase